MTKNEINAGVTGTVDYQLRLKQLHGVNKLNFIIDRNEKITELFSQMENDIQIMKSPNTQDYDNVQAIEKSFQKLIDWCDINRGLFSPKQWQVVVNKISTFNTFTHNKHEWLSDETQREISRLKGLVEYYKNVLHEHGISITHPEDEEKKPETTIDDEWDWYVSSIFGE